jgi:hypothetical protein
VIQSAGAAYGNDTIEQINFTGASNYEITGSSVSNIGNGVTLGAVATDGNVTFAGNLTLGTGSDFGELSVSRQNGGTVGANASDNLIVNNGWQLNLAGTTTNWTQTTYLNGLGQSQGQTGTISIAGGTASNEGVTGNVILQSDAAIIGTPSATNYPTQMDTLSGNISGSANLYIGYNGVGTGAAGNTQKFIVGGTTASGNPTASTNTGSTIIFNSTAGDATGGVSNLSVQLGQTNGLSTSTSLILGETGSYSEINGITAPNSDTTGVVWKTSDGAFDLAGYNQSLKGIMVGGVAQKSGTTPTDVLLQSNNIIYNNSGAGTSILTITGTTGNAVSTGFGGIIEDYATTSGGKVGVEVNGGTLMLSGANTYSGGTTVDHFGTLEVGTSSNSTVTENSSVVGTFGSTSGTLAVNTGGTVDLEGQSVSVGAMTLGTSGSGTTSGTIQNSSTTHVGVLYTTGVTVTGTGNSIAANTSVISGTGGISIGSGSGLSLAGTIDNANVSGTLSGAGGTGMITGTLNLQSGGVLNSGTINPSTGKPYGPLAASIINFSGPAELAFALSTTATSGVDTTSVINAGSLTGGSNVITVLVTGGSGSLGTNQKILLLTYTSNTSGITFQLNDQSSDAGTLDWDTIDDELFLMGPAAIPEPPAWLLLLGGVGLLALWRRVSARRLS